MSRAHTLFSPLYLMLMMIVTVQLIGNKLEKSIAVPLRQGREFYSEHLEKMFEKVRVEYILGSFVLCVYFCNVGLLPWVELLPSGNIDHRSH